MDVELYNKIKSECKKSSLYNAKWASRLKSELDFMAEAEVLSNLWNLYHKVKETGNPGNKNTLNSWVAFVLGITNVSPTGEFKIEKRRTYGRDGFPDIDMDFDYERRHEIIEYFIDKYGSEHVGNIGTVMRLKTKAALRRVIKALDPEDSVVYDSHGNKIKNDDSENFRLQNEILNELPDMLRKADGSIIKSIEEAYNEFPNFRRYMDAYPDVYRMAKKLEGSVSAFSCHAAGMVISPLPLARIAPLHVTRGEDKNKVVATQFPMFDVESLGLIKFDVLGLSTKTAIALAVQDIKDMYGVGINLANLPLTDEKTLRLLSSGKTDGCFQLENTGMKQALQQIGIDCFNDLVVAVAMYRPGPKDYIPEYAQRKRGVRQVRYPHETVRDITLSTYGVIIFQEQVMQVFMSMADLTATDGYTFMKGCAKKKTELIDKFKDKFKKGALKQKIPSEVINKVWGDLEKFGGYAFNKCLSFSTQVKNPITSKIHHLEDLLRREDKGKGFVIESKFGDETIHDEVVEVFETGKKYLYEIILSNGMLVECTLDHKFLCSDNEFYTVSEILEGDLEVLYEK